jgi:hypothetical protein
MPYTLPNGKRDYKRQGALVDSKPEARAHRADNVKQNRELAKAGIGHKGDGMDASHKTAFSKGGQPTLANTKLEAASTNRSFSRTPTGAMKTETSKREKK